MIETVPGGELHERLARWVSEGLIDDAQAVRIEAAEAARAAAAGAARTGVAAATPAETAEAVPPAAAPAPGRPPAGATAGTGVAAAGPPGPAGGPAGAAAAPPATAPAAGRARGRRVPLTTEALGYLGGALVIAGGFVLVGRVWPNISAGAELTLAAIGAVALGIVGALMRTDSDPAFARLRNVIWVLSTACLASFTGVLADRVGGLPGASTAIITGGVTAAYAAVLWLRTRSGPQQIAMFVAVAVTAGSAIAQAGPGLRDWAPGLGVWVLSALWAGAVYRGLIGPRGVGYVAAGIGLLIGAQLTMQVAAGHVLALLTVAALLAAGVALRQVWLLGIGTVGVIQVVPQTAARYLPMSAAVPLAIFVVGLALLAVALWLSRWRQRPPTR